MLWAQGVPLVALSLVAMSYYRTTKEMCFYCRFTIVVGNMQTAMLQALLSFSGKTTWPFVITMGTFATCAVMITEATRSAKKSVHKERMRKRELEKEARKKKGLGEHDNSQGYDKSMSLK